jgi:hypothetical protein
MNMQKCSQCPYLNREVVCLGTRLPNYCAMFTPEAIAARIGDKPLEGVPSGCSKCDEQKRIREELERRKDRFEKNQSSKDE